MINNNGKKFILETVDDPNTRANFDVVAKQIQKIIDYLKPNFSISTTNLPLSTQVTVFQEVDNLRTSLTTTGNPVLLFLQPRRTDISYTGAIQAEITGSPITSLEAGALIIMKRDGVEFYKAVFGLFIQGLTGATSMTLAVGGSSVLAMDVNCPAGFHTWQLGASDDTGNPGGIAELANLQLAAIELK